MLITHIKAYPGMAFFATFLSPGLSFFLLRKCYPHRALARDNTVIRAAKLLIGYCDYLKDPDIVYINDRSFLSFRRRDLRLVLFDAQ